MENTIILISPVPGKDSAVSNPLFYPAVQWVADTVSAVSPNFQILDECFLADNGSCISQYAAELLAKLPADCRVLSFCKPLPAITQRDLSKIFAHRGLIAHSPESGDIVLVLSTAGNLLKNGVLSDFEEYSAEQPLSLTEVSASAFPQICAELRKRANAKFANSGVILTDSDATYISPSVQLEAGVTVLPGCIIRGSSHIKTGAVIGPNCVLENACIGNNSTVNSSQIFDSSVGDNTTVGPFAYIRPECSVGSNVRVGDFVELKKSSIGNNTKISHLTYIGDAEVGERVNFGCGCVTANYDGKLKHRTVIGNDVFLGCNTNLVAPVNVGSNAFTAAGSTITHDVPENSLVIARAPETLKEDWAIKHSKRQ